MVEQSVLRLSKRDLELHLLFQPSRLRWFSVHARCLPSRFECRANFHSVQLCTRCRLFSFSPHTDSILIIAALTGSMNKIAEHMTLTHNLSRFVSLRAVLFSIPFFFFLIQCFTDLVRFLFGWKTCGLWGYMLRHMVGFLPLLFHAHRLKAIPELFTLALTVCFGFFTLPESRWTVLTARDYDLQSVSQRVWCPSALRSDKVPSLVIHPGWYVLLSCDFSL